MAKRKAAPGAADPVVAASAAATRAVVQIGRHGGRGFIIVGGERRYVVTAAHCIFDKLPVPHPARDSNEVTYRNLIGPLGGKRRVSAECVFLDRSLISLYSARPTRRSGMKRRRLTRR